MRRHPGDRRADRGAVRVLHRGRGRHPSSPRARRRQRLSRTGSPGSAIPIGARIVAVADVYDALTSDRPYRRAMSRDDGAARISRRRPGRGLDEEIVGAFLGLVRARRSRDAMWALRHPPATAAVPFCAGMGGRRARLAWRALRRPGPSPRSDVLPPEAMAAVLGVPPFTAVSSPSRSCGRACGPRTPPSAIVAAGARAGARRAASARRARLSRAAGVAGASCARRGRLSPARARRAVAVGAGRGRGAGGERAGAAPRHLRVAHARVHDSARRRRRSLPRWRTTSARTSCPPSCSSAARCCTTSGAAGRSRSRSRARRPPRRSDTAVDPFVRHDGAAGGRRRVHDDARGPERRALPVVGQPASGARRRRHLLRMLSTAGERVTRVVGAAGRRGRAAGARHGRHRPRRCGPRVAAAPPLRGARRPRRARLRAPRRGADRRRRRAAVRARRAAGRRAPRSHGRGGGGARDDDPAPRPRRDRRRAAHADPPPVATAHVCCVAVHTLLARDDAIEILLRRLRALLLARLPIRDVALVLEDGCVRVGDGGGQRSGIGGRATSCGPGARSSSPTAAKRLRPRRVGRGRADRRAVAAWARSSWRPTSCR